MSPSQSTRQSKSTGPRTPEGKHRASLNALRHGLTGRVVVLPSEDMNAYHAFCKELMSALAPDGPLESQYAQTFCDTQWRLNRIRSIEESLFALGHYEKAGAIDGGHPQIHAAFTNARVFREQSQAFANLSLYEQRLQRTLKESLRQLRELQALRAAAVEAAAAAVNAAGAEPAPERHVHAEPPDPSPGQFVFSTAETPAEASVPTPGANPVNPEPGPLEQAA